MHDNPYQASAAEPLSSEPSAARPGQPLGIVVLALLNLAFGVVSLLFLGLVGIGGVLPGLITLAIDTVLPAVAAFGSSVGMLLGRRMGWWLAAFLYFDGICRDATGLAVTLFTVDELDFALGYVLVPGVRMLIVAVFLLYLFRRKVLVYFGLQRAGTLKALVIVPGVVLPLRALEMALAVFRHDTPLTVACSGSTRSVRSRTRSRPAVLRRSG